MALSETITVWEAVDPDGKVFLYPMKPIWRTHLGMWTCPHVEGNLQQTVRNIRSRRKYVSGDEPRKITISKDEYLGLTALYR